MANTERDTTIVTTSGSSGAAWFLVGALLVGLIGGAYYFLGDHDGGGDLNIDVKIPATN